MKTGYVVSISSVLLGCGRGTTAQPPAPDMRADTTIEAPSTPGQPGNRLAREKSPYLLQHQHNPVDWQPWGQEAFDQARREHKPVFLSIGYSTCHWCHVMERESFESENLARFLNTHFISIKVDREERPDVDQIYMTFVQATTGQGGWPLTVFLAPDRNPFYGGTYFPPEPRYGKPGFLELLRQIQQLWQTRPEEIVRSAAELRERLAQHTDKQPPGEFLLTPALLRQAATAFKQEYDPRHGGFGRAPKFPRPSQPAFLLNYGLTAGDPEAVRMVLHTCERMAAGGIYDHLGGGFARYSVDEKWLVPHFEKMLYDNAQLAPLYLEAFLASGDQRFAAVARDLLRYVLRDLTHPDGGFYSAEDADSEGKEGKFYCWTKAELASLLTPEELRVAARYFGVTETGNFLDHSDPNPLPGQNVLHVASSELEPAEARPLAAARQKMLDARAKRVRPHLDDKVLASWNGLMLGALARAYAVLGEQRYLKAARRNLDFLKAKLWDTARKTLYHRWRDGERDSVQLLDAYAFLLPGVLDLYEATLEPACLVFAVDLADTMINRFYDREHGGFWQSPADAPDLILRLKEDYDGALPSGNSVAVSGLLRLAAITGRTDFKQAAEKSLRLFAERLHHVPQAVPALLAALDFWLEEPARVVIVGESAAPDASRLLMAAHSVYRPRKVILGVAGPVDPFVRTLPVKDERPTAYVCLGTTCQPPTHDPETLRTHLKR